MPGTIIRGWAASVGLSHRPPGMSPADIEGSIMNFNLFSVIAASAISASVVLPVHASERATERKSTVSSYTQSYLKKSATFYAALDHSMNPDSGK
jgi:hypothetical protein